MVEIQRFSFKDSIKILGMVSIVQEWKNRLCDGL